MRRLLQAIMRRIRGTIRGRTVEVPNHIRATLLLPPHWPACATHDLAGPVRVVWELMTDPTKPVCPITRASGLPKIGDEHPHPYPVPRPLPTLSLYVVRLRMEPKPGHLGAAYLVVDYGWCDGPPKLPPKPKLHNPKD